MESKSEGETSKDGESKENVLLHFMGKNRFNNEMLADYLREQTGYACRCNNSYQIEGVIEGLAGTISLIFLDCTGLDYFTLSERTDIDLVLNNDNCLIVLFRVNPECEIESMALKKGMRGIIYNHQPIEVFPKAVRVILRGELWYPRRILERHITGNDYPAYVQGKEWQTLTAREKEILKMLASGKRNKEIANNFFISHHTVKTHVYNIFRKLKVKNRLQASLVLSNRN